MMNIVIAVVQWNVLFQKAEINVISFSYLSF